MEEQDVIEWRDEDDTKKVVLGHEQVEIRVSGSTLNSALEPEGYVSASCLQRRH